MADLAAGESLRTRGRGNVFVGLLGSYALATTTGLPVLHPDPEPVDGLALATKAIESIGLFAAASLLWRPRRRHCPATERKPDMSTTQARAPFRSR